MTKAVFKSHFFYKAAKVIKHLCNTVQLSTDIRKLTAELALVVPFFGKAI